MREESFKSRYFVKIASSVAIGALNIVIQILLPRTLSVEEFGYYSYNLNIFTSTVVLANLSMSNAFVAKFSRRNDEIGLVYFYLKYYVAEIILLSIGLIVFFNFDFVQKTFVGQTITMVFLGLEAAATIKFLADVVSIYDAMAIAKVSAFFQILLKLFVCAFVVLSYFIGRLSLPLFYIGQCTITFAITLILLLNILKYQKKQYPAVKTESTRFYSEEYARFCRPLIISSVLSQIIIIVMNWCLMQFSGAKEQAMFGAAWQLNALVTYVFAPYAELSKREYSIISKDNEALIGFYNSSLKRMFWLTAYFACFIGFCNDWVLNIVYGDKYLGAGIVTLLIMIYTIYQAWGQMSGSFMLATERTKMSATIGIVGQFITLGLVFVFQIPNFIWPNGLGSVGIALVYVVGNFINVCLSVWLTTRAIGMSSVKALRIQFFPMLLCSSLAFSLNKMMNLIATEMTMTSSILKLFFAGMIYTIIILVLFYLFPSQIDCSKEKIRDIIKLVTRVSPI